MLTSALRHLRRIHDALRQTEHIYMVIVSVVVGVLGGLGAVGFRLLISAVNESAWHEGNYTLSYIAGLPWWWKIAAPTVGGLLVGLITYRFAREAKGHGVPEVMEAVALLGGRIRPRIVIAKLFASGICIGTGGSVGREGPIVHIGSALGSTIGQWLKIDQQRMRTLVGCGAAAGIAATFNAPVAGALFAVEVILGDFGVTQFSPIVISSVIGTVVSQHFLGDFPAFQVPHYSMVHATELFAYAALGILAGFAALLFIRMLYGAEDLFDRIRLPLPVQGMIGGAAVGAIGIWLPHVFGVGYEAINEALNGKLVWDLMLLLVVAKLVAVSITIGSGGSGGIFAPSLFIGAMLGGAVGYVMHLIWGDAAGGPGAYALVGMGAVVAAATHAPITAIVMIFELTNDYKIILPLMICCIIATLLATQLQSGSIYTLKLLRRGVDIRGGKALNVLESAVVSEEMKPELETVAPGDTLTVLINKFVEHPGSVLFVVDGDNHLLGILTAEAIRPAIADAAGLSSLVIAEDLMTTSGFPKLSPDDSLAGVMKLLGKDHGELPVLSDGKLIGVIWPQDVIKRYNTELFKRDMARGMASAVSDHESAIGVSGTNDAVVAEVPVPDQFAGRTIADLNIRQQFGCNILMIKRTRAGGAEKLIEAPRADFTFQTGDVVVALGTTKNLRLFKLGVPLG